MTPDQLKVAAIELFGEAGFTAKLAEHLRVDRTTVYRMINGQVPVSGPVEAAVRCWLKNGIE